MSENKIRFGVGFSEFIGARDNSSIEIKDGKISGRALFVLDAKMIVQLVSLSKRECKVFFFLKKFLKIHH